MAIKSRNHRNNVLKHLYFSQQQSCTELSLKIDKSLPITARILNELMEEGYVEEKGFAASTGGRRAITYSLRPEMMYTVSVAMDQFYTRIVIMDLQNNFVTPVTRIELPLANNAHAFPVLTEKINQVIRTSGIPTEKIAGIGVAMPGFVDVTKGLNYSFLESGGRSIATIIEEKTSIPVLIDNDSRMIALAELKFGAARNKKNSLVINIGWGVGLGMVVSGKLFRGNIGFAGEFSHLPLFNNDKLCSCGKAGCLETETSMLVLVKKAKEGLESGRSCNFSNLPDDYEEACNIILEAAVKGDQFALELLSSAAYDIGRGIAVLIHIMNPEQIVLSGRGALAGKLWLASVQQAVNRYCIPSLAAYTDITISSLGNEAELIGAAALVFENFDKVTEDDYYITRADMD